MGHEGSQVNAPVTHGMRNIVCPRIMTGSSTAVRGMQDAHVRDYDFFAEFRQADKPASS
ncbi:hypothetical protein DFO67_10577 [Modicisalibacter xianhensis]|uniref:Uncharacterized protein n=1 Tax=Modicisalibacter xianhensis TaxID=442341 RepID=A0A1I3BY69_9GAMM|nr:hypothetical protein DFO67_10577 [Halomonas xianhensis]SFH67308.1 hypothetical protein SAMN04487959_107222 [Halomonas xianhensis]